MRFNRRKMLDAMNDTLFIMNVTGVHFEHGNDTDGDHLAFIVSSSSQSPTYITFNGVTKTVRKGNTEVDFETTATGNIYFIGGYSSISLKTGQVAPQTYGRFGIINSIVKWYTHKDFLFRSFLGNRAGNAVDLEINLPSNIKRLSPECLSLAYNLGVSFLTLHMSPNIERLGDSSGPPIVVASSSNPPVKNATLISNLWVLDDFVLGLGVETSTSAITIPENIKVLPSYLLGDADEVLYASRATTITVASGIKSIPDSCFKNSYLTTAIFLQPKGFRVSFPTPGSNITGSTGAFYQKNSTALTVITNNQDVANYDYSTDNRTATLRHLDQSFWGTLAQPTISKSGDNLTINAVTNATYYRIEGSGLGVGNYNILIKDISNPIDLTQYIPTTEGGNLSLSVRAFANGYKGSIKSATVSYTRT